MTDAAITLGEAGELRLSGRLDHRSGAGLREAGRELIRASAADPLVVDCAQVEKSSSVGLALLLAFMRDVQGEGRSLVVSHLPDDMREIARVSGLLEILPSRG